MIIIGQRFPYGVFSPEIPCRSFFGDQNGIGLGQSGCDISFQQWKRKYFQKTRVDGYKIIFIEFLIFVTYQSVG